jgi:tRNA1Val (adenine37-N6)-methyltransferase
MSIFKFKYFEIDQDNDVFKVGTDALVLGAWINPTYPLKSVLDIGTGTGVIGLMLAQKFPEAQVDAWDINPKAVRLANHNFKKNAIGKNCKAIQSDFRLNKQSITYDLIVSNPPYFIDAKKSTAVSMATSRHFSQVDMFCFLAQISKMMHQKSQCALIYPSDSQFDHALSKFELFPANTLYIYGKPKQLVRKCVLLTKDKNCENQIDALTIRDEFGAYTSEYIELTKEYHGKAIDR